MGKHGQMKLRHRPTPVAAGKNHRRPCHGVILRILSIRLRSIAVVHDFSCNALMGRGFLQLPPSSPDQSGIRRSEFSTAAQRFCARRRPFGIGDITVLRRSDPHFSAGADRLRKIAPAPCQSGGASQAILRTLRTLPFHWPEIAGVANSGQIEWRRFLRVIPIDRNSPSQEHRDIRACPATMLTFRPVRAHAPLGRNCANLARMRASRSWLERASMGKLSRRAHGLQASITTRALRGSSWL